MTTSDEFRRFIHVDDDIIINLDDVSRVHRGFAMVASSSETLGSFVRFFFTDGSYLDVTGNDSIRRLTTSLHAVGFPMWKDLPRPVTR